MWSKNRFKKTPTKSLAKEVLKHLGLAQYVVDQIDKN